jgi:hypothetical protein
MEEPAANTSLAAMLDGIDSTTLDNLHALVDEINRREFEHDPSRRCELVAFSLCESSGGAESREWRGRFIPAWVGRDETGAERPTVAEVIDADAVRHWARRSEESQSSLLRARYADLVWEFGRLASLRSPGRFAIRAIDAYAKVGEPGSRFRRHIRHSALSRCLELSRSLNDVARATAAANRVAEEGAMEGESDPFWAAWLLTENGEARLVVESTSARLEEAMLKMIQDGQASSLLLQPAMLLEWMGRLVAYRSARGIGTSESRKTVGDLVAAILGSVERMDGLIALDALPRLRALAEGVGLARELGAIDAAIRDAGVRAGRNMTNVSVPMDNLEPGIERFLEWAIDDNLTYSFVRVVTGPLPSRESVEAAAKNSMGQIESLFTHTSVTNDGRPGSVHSGSGLDGVRLGRGRGLGLAIARLFTRSGLKRLSELDPRWTRLMPQLLQSCSPSTMQDPQTTLAVALAYRHKNWPAMTTLLVLRLEPLLLELARAKRISWLRSNSSGGLNAAGNDGLIADETMRAAMGEKLSILIDHVFEPQGLRHSVAHGQRRDSQFSEDDALTALQAVVGLGIAVARAEAARPSSGNA